jgi:hypothetical protein
MDKELLARLRVRLQNAKRSLGPLTRIATDQPYAMCDALLARELCELTDIVSEILEQTR